MQLNKIYNEDCLVGIKKIPDNSVDLVIIDPPYDICTKGGKKGSGSLCYDLTKLENELKANNLVNGYGYVSIAQLTENNNISRPVFKNVLQKMKDSKVAEVTNKGVKGTYIEIIDSSIL